VGYQDRDYIREHRASFRVRGRVVVWLIGVTIATFGAQVVAEARGFDAARWFGIVPQRLAQGWLWQLVTSAFLHGGPGHLFWNMLFLWMIGTEVAEVYGVRKFLGLYLGGAALGAVAHAVAGAIDGRPEVPAIGASAAVLGVAVVGALLFPNRPVWLFGLFEPPLWLVVAGLVVYDAYALVTHGRPGVAVAAHLGGALFGLLFWRVPVNLSWFRRWIARVRFSRRPAPEEVDRILAKISAEGIGSLTDAERDVLKRASQ
jgi:membrane associated rhomboid family serine protease